MRILQLAIGLMLLLSSAPSLAEQKFVKNDWDIHYIAFPSSFLQPEVARQYKLQRSKYMAVVNISVLDNKNDDKAQNVFVNGTAKNLLGQSKPLVFTKVTEGDAIYYLAQLKYNNEEVYNFNIDVQAGNRTETIKFSKKLYAD